MTKKSQQTSRIESFLKDTTNKPTLQENDKQKIKDFIDRKLFAADNVVKQSPLARVWESASTRVQNIPRFYQFHRKNLMSFRKDTMPLCFFVFFTTYVLYKMESTQNNI